MASTVIKPVIKWSGSKRSQARFIASMLPRFRHYYEPFVGGGSVAYAVAPDRGTCGDIVAPLIALWNQIKDAPNELSSSYRENWSILQSIGPEHYYRVRQQFNENKDAASLLFLSRTCVNGLIRFNTRGDFNNSFHLTRRGIDPDRLQIIINDWSDRIRNLQFLSGDYHETTAGAQKGDFVYLDPPYMNTTGRYFGTSTIDFQELFEYLEELNHRGVMWGLSFDGYRETKTYSHHVPEDLYLNRMSISSGHSPFKRVQEKKLEAVYESLYVNFHLE